MIITLLIEMHDLMLLLFATTRFVIKSVKVPIVDVAKLIPLDFAIDPLMTSQSGVWC